VSEQCWFTEDIHHIILAAVRANQDALSAGLAGTDPWRKRTYHQRFRAALSTLALALGLPQLPPVDGGEQCTVVERSEAPTNNRYGPAVAEARGPKVLALCDAGEEVSLEGGPALVR
jgi:hypothetical protein